MTFEEFFKKKKIDVSALEKSEQGLFSEFQIHFEQMGEKSFDHSKKYWFNKLRRQFPLPVEIKTEKLHIANPLAEQTITESLSETTSTPPLPKLGFAPKFKAANPPSPIANPDEKQEDAEIKPAAENKTVEGAEPKPAAYQPRFKMKLKTEAEENTPPAAAEQPVQDTEAKPAYQPRFKMKPKTETEENSLSPIIEEPSVTEQPPVENTGSKPAYKPRFKMQPKSKTDEE